MSATLRNWKQCTGMICSEVEGVGLCKHNQIRNAWKRNLRKLQIENTLGYNRVMLTWLFREIKKHDIRYETV